MAKIPYLLIVFMLICVSTVSAFGLYTETYPFAHPSAYSYSQFGSMNVDAIDTSTAISGFDDIHFPVVLSMYDDTLKAGYYMNYANNFFDFWGFKDDTLQQLGNFEVASADYEILSAVSIDAYETNTILAVLHNTITDAVTVNTYTVEHSSQYITGVTLEDTYLTGTIDTMEPLTAIDCDILNGLEAPQHFFCAYGTTKNGFVTVDSSDSSLNNVINITDKTLELFDTSKYIIEAVPISVIASHGKTYEIVAVTNATQVISIDVDDCSGSTSCELNSASYEVYENNDYYRIDHFTGIEYDLYSFSALPDTGKMACFINKKIDNSRYAMKFNCLYDNTLIKDVFIINSTQANTVNNDAYQLSTIPIPIAGFYDAGGLQACVRDSHLYVPSTSYYSFMSCVSLVSEQVVNIGTGISTGHVMMAGSGNVFNNDTTYIVAYDYGSDIIFAQKANSSVKHTLSTIDSDASQIFLSDLDNNGEQELFQMKDGSAVVYYEYQASIPQVEYDDTIDYSGLFGFFNPAEANTTQTIRARECDYLTNELCTYAFNTHSVFDRERLCTTCNDTVAETCGSWSYSEPTVTCNFSSAGTYDVDVNLYSEDTASINLHTFTINDWVINTDANDLDNLVISQSPDITTTTTSVTTTTLSSADDDDAQTFLDAIQNNIKPIIGLFLIIFVMGSLASQGIREPIILALAGIIATIIVAVLGLISFVFLLYILIALIILIVLFTVVFKSGGQ